MHINKMDQLAQVLRKSAILTTRPTPKSHSLPLLLPCPPPSKNTPEPRKNPQNQDRLKTLLRLKAELPPLQPSVLPAPNLSCPQSLGDKLEAMMKCEESRTTKTRASEEASQKKNKLQEQFESACESISQVLEVCRQEGDFRIRNGVLKIATSMKSWPTLKALIQALEGGHSKPTLWRNFSRDFEANDCYFHRDLKSLALQSQYKRRHYQDHRFGFLNQDINRRKEQIQHDGRLVGNRLGAVEDPSLRKGIFQSLSGVRLGCRANRFYYEEHLRTMESHFGHYC